jgi:hypothetical protein
MNGARTSAALLMAALGLGCRPSETPVAVFDASPSRLELAWPEHVEVRLAFEPKIALPAGTGEPIVFVHLLDEPGSVVRTFDHPLPFDWQPGRRVEYPVRIFESALGEPLEAGEYLLSVGLYRPGQERFALETGAEEIARLEYRVASVGVAPPSERMAQARFSEHWLPPEPGVDRQVLARRALAGGTIGTIELGPVESAGRLYLALAVPPDEGGASRLEILDGGTLPKVRIASSCGGDEVEISGSGRFDVDLDVPPAEAARICEISIAPNFQRRTTERAEATSVRLEVLSWGRAGDDAAD